jgi:hypothetical protein
VRTTIFSAALRRLLVGEKDWSWSFALNFCVFLFKQKENKKYKIDHKRLLSPVLPIIILDNQLVTSGVFSNF